jgi:hypothetical protein
MNRYMPDHDWTAGLIDTIDRRTWDELGEKTADRGDGRTGGERFAYT